MSAFTAFILFYTVTSLVIGVDAVTVLMVDSAFIVGFIIGRIDA